MEKLSDFATFIFHFLSTTYPSVFNGNRAIFATFAAKRYKDDAKTEGYRDEPAQSGGVQAKRETPVGGGVGSRKELE